MENFTLLKLKPLLRSATRYLAAPLSTKIVSLVQCQEKVIDFRRMVLNLAGNISNEYLRVRLLILLPAPRMYLL